MYREHFLGAEFIGLVVYAEAGLETRERRQALARLDEVAAAHARFSTPALRVERIAEFVKGTQVTPYGIAGLLTSQPAFAAEFAGRLKELTGDLVERLGRRGCSWARWSTRPGCSSSSATRATPSTSTGIYNPRSTGSTGRRSSRCSSRPPGGSPSIRCGATSKPGTAERGMNEIV